MNVNYPLTGLMNLDSDRDTTRTYTPTRAWTGLCLPSSVCLSLALPSAPQAPYHQVVELPREMAPEGRPDAGDPGRPASPFCLCGAQLLTAPSLLPVPPFP